MTRKPRLLLDNKQSNVDAWRSVGGLGYLHEGDDAFADDASRMASAV